MRTKHSNMPGGHEGRGRRQQSALNGDGGRSLARVLCLTIRRAALAITFFVILFFSPAAKKGKKAKKAKKTKKKAAKKGQRESGSERKLAEDPLYVCRRRILHLSHASVTRDSFLLLHPLAVFSPGKKAKAKKKKTTKAKKGKKGQPPRCAVR